MRRQQQLLLVAILAILVLSVVNIGYAAMGVSWQRPNSTTNIKCGNYKISTKAWNTTQEQWNVSFYYRKFGTTTWTLLKANKTENKTSYNYTFAVGSRMYDNQAYTFNVTWYNGSGNKSGGGKHGERGSNATSLYVTSDCTKPKCSITTPKTNTVYHDMVQFVMNANNATNCSLTVGHVVIKPELYANGTQAAETCRFNVTTSLVPEGMADWDAATIDRGGSNRTACTTIVAVTLKNEMSTVRASVIASESEPEAAATAKGASAPGNQNGALVLAIAVIIGVAWYQRKK